MVCVGILVCNDTFSACVSCVKMASEIYIWYKVFTSKLLATLGEELQVRHYYTFK